MCSVAVWIWSPALQQKSMHGQQTVLGQIKKAMLSWIKDKPSCVSPLLHSLMLKSNTSSPNKPWACVLFPWAVDLDPARHRPKRTRSALVSWLLPWRPKQIRHDECRLFVVWQIHLFTVGWCLHEGQHRATLSLEETEWGKEQTKKGYKEDKKSTRKYSVKWNL